MMTLEMAAKKESGELFEMMSIVRHYAEREIEAKAHINRMKALYNVASDNYQLAINELTYIKREREDALLQYDVEPELQCEDEVY